MQHSVFREHMPYAPAIEFDAADERLNSEVE
jgi:hypothetical protein